MEEQETVEKKSNIKLVYGFIGVLVFILILVLIGVKWANSEFKIASLLFWFFGGSILLGAVGGGFHYYSYKQTLKEEIAEEKELKLPPAKSTDESRVMADKILSDKHFEYFASSPIDGSGQFGKSGRTSIYTKVGKGLYTKIWYAIIINQHYPERNTILEVKDISDPTIAKWQNRLAVDPQEAPITRKQWDSNPLLGTERYSEETEPSKSEDKKKAKKKKGDL